MMARAWNSSTQEAEVGRSEVSLGYRKPNLNVFNVAVWAHNFSILGELDRDRGIPGVCFLANQAESVSSGVNEKHYPKINK